ncbi:hypothetical protein Nepgr_015221 [Nepenthes gracilis]|uniref:Amino acid transporter transmembrane domain-containing protein n=1 Tax=Nepenthes gracilis TaxID=150966 RepID=A0AAD3XRA6_NEPGR|nr:hypothetical protein Nepgr_015221 [Nepenthes gracilis]
MKNDGSRSLQVEWLRHLLFWLEALSLIDSELSKAHRAAAPQVSRKNSKMAEDQLRSPLIQRTGGSGFIKSCFNATNAFLGIGLLTVPYALSRGGWLSLALFFLIGIITFYTGILLTRCMDLDPSTTTYLDIAERAFGKTGRIVGLIIMNCDLYLVSIGLLILEGDNLHKLFPKYRIHLGALAIDGRRSFIILTALVISPTMLLTDLGILSYVSATGIFSCFIIIASVICVGALEGVGFHGKGELLNLAGIPTALSLYIVCFAGHPVIPSIYTSAKHPQQLSKVLLCSFFVTTMTYALMAVTGYLMFGDGVESQITLNLPTKAVSAKVAIYTTLLIPVTRYALMMTPVASAIESGMSEEHLSKRLIRILIRLALLVSTVVVAYLFPYFESLMSIIGSVFVVLVSFLLPCFCYLKISGSRRCWSWKSVGNIGIIVFATFAGVIGTYSSIAQLVREMS